MNNLNSHLARLAMSAGIVFAASGGAPQAADSTTRPATQSTSEAITPPVNADVIWRTESDRVGAGFNTAADTGCADCGCGGGNCSC